MKNLKLIFIVTLVITFSFGQNNLKNNTEPQTKQKSIISSKTSTKKNEIRDAKIYIFKEKDKTDYSKYIIALVSLLLGIVINKLLDFWNDKKSINQSGKRWIIELRSVEVPIKTQINELERFLKELEKINWDLPTLRIYTVINGEVFKSLDKNELVKYIEMKNSIPWYKFKSKNIKLDNFKKIIDISNTTHGHIGILVHQFDTLKEKWQSLLDGISKTTNSLHQNLKQINTEIMVYGAALAREGINVETDARYKPLFDLYMKEVILNKNKDNFNPLELEQKFFNPVVFIIANLVVDERIIKLSTTVSECFNDLQSIKAEKTYMIESCNTLIKRYKNQIEKLNPLINRIEGKI